MAQKRMLNKSISTSIQVNKLNLKERLIFTWIIPHLDDYGLIDKEPELIKALVLPMAKDITEKDITDFIKKAKELKLIEVFDDCLEYTGFNNHQTISESKKSRSKFHKYSNPQESPRIPKNPLYKEVKEVKEENKGIKELDALKEDLISKKIIK